MQKRTQQETHTQKRYPSNKRIEHTPNCEINIANSKFLIWWILIIKSWQDITTTTSKFLKIKKQRRAEKLARPPPSLNAWTAAHCAGCACAPISCRPSSCRNWWWPAWNKLSTKRKAKTTSQQQDNEPAANKQCKQKMIYGPSLYSEDNEPAANKQCKQKMARACLRTRSSSLSFRLVLVGLCQTCTSCSKSFNVKISNSKFSGIPLVTKMLKAIVIAL